MIILLLLFQAEQGHKRRNSRMSTIQNNPDITASPSSKKPTDPNNHNDKTGNTEGVKVIVPIMPSDYKEPNDQGNSNKPYNEFPVSAPASTIVLEHKREEVHPLVDLANVRNLKKYCHKSRASSIHDKTLAVNATCILIMSLVILKASELYQTLSLDHSNHSTACQKTNNRRNNVSVLQRCREMNCNDSEILLNVDWTR